MTRTSSLAAIVCTACALPVDPAGQTSSAIVNGFDSDASQDAVVLLLYDDPSTGFSSACSGILLAPTLVLTARHCVSETDSGATCNPDGSAASGGNIYSDLDPTFFSVFAGATRPDFLTGSLEFARGEEIITDGATNFCDHDIALLRTDGWPDRGVIAPVRLDSEPSVGELVTVVGWGRTESTSAPETRQQRQLAVLELGPGGRLGPSELLVGEGPCSGDSGGPALAESTGAVVGVLSRGGDGDVFLDPSGCIDAVNVYGATNRRRDLILEGYAAVGQEPWLEGEPNPIGGGRGATCAADVECTSSLCHPTEGRCTQDCASAACPLGYSCTEAEGRMLCSVAGCAAAPGRGARGLMLAVCACLALVLARRKRAK